MLCFGMFVQRIRDPLRAMVSIDDYGHEDGNWLHISISRASRLPSWADLVTARDELGYRDWFFMQMLPPARNWLNVHKYTMHLLSRLDRETVPRVLWTQDGADGSAYGQHR